MRIGIATDSLAPLTAAGATAVLQSAGFDVRQIVDAARWRRAIEPDSRCVLVAGCASRQDCGFFLKISETAPQIPTIALVATPALSQSLLRHGVSVVLPLAISVDWLVIAVEAIGAGLSIAPHVAFPDRTPAGGRGRDPTLTTDQEIDWLRILASGVTIGRLADTVGYSERNMKRLLARTYRKLNVSTRTEALVEAARRGLLD